MLNEKDKEIRKAIIESEGNLKLAAEILGVTYDHLRDRLRSKKQNFWWRKQKAKFSRLRKRQREIRAYANAKIKAKERDLRGNNIG